MSEPASISSGIAQRYATALFDLAKQAGELDSLEADTSALAEALSESDDLKSMIHSPVYSRDEQTAAISALTKTMGLSGLVSNTLALMGTKRRLFVLPQLVTALRKMIADEKGEVTAEIVSATPLSDEQSAKLADAIARQVGKQIQIQTTVDENLIGGLVVKVGSQMIDTSIASKLANLQNAMKEVG